jgi:hypothetical protein
MRQYAGLEILKGARRSLTVATLAMALLPISGEALAAHHKAKSATRSTTSSAKPETESCKTTPERSSIGIRALQTELMVAGLKCSAEEWNNFTAKFKTTIKSDADRMQKLFVKTYGSTGPNRMNAFVTQLANDASQRSNNSAEVDYCRQEEVLFKQVLALTGEELERFAVHRALAVPAPVALCGPDPVVSPTTTASATSSSPVVAASVTAPGAATAH